MADERRERIAHNEALFREINEALQHALSDQADCDRCAFRCECADRSCNTLVHLTTGEYEAVRAHSRRFIVIPGHEVPDVEDVLERNERYAVVLKHEDLRNIVEGTDRRRA